MVVSKKTIFMTMMTIMMIMVNLLLCGQKRKKGEGKGCLPRDPSTLFDRAVAAAVAGDDDHDDHDEPPFARGRVESICGIGPMAMSVGWSVGHH